MVDQQLGPSALEAFQGEQLSVEETISSRESVEKSLSYLKTPTKAKSLIACMFVYYNLY